MTDKEKLKEIKKLADAMYYAAFNLTTDASLLRKAMKEYHQFIIHEYCKEDPVAPKVLEDMLNAKTAAESLGIPQEEHDRIVDELIYGKEPELVDVDDLPNKEEEPVSEKKCMYTKDSYTDEDRKVLCDGCEEECKYAQREEPVNKDFELALAEMIDKAQKCVVEPWVVAAQWKDELIKLAKSEEPVSDDTMTIRKEWFEQCKKSWYNEGYIDGKHNRDSQFGEPVSEELSTELDAYIKDNFTIEKDFLEKYSLEEKDYMYSMDKSDMLKMIRHFTNNYKVPTSDVLEEAAKLCVSDYFCITNEEDWDEHAVDALNIFKIAAQWQKQQDQKTKRIKL